MRTATLRLNPALVRPAIAGPATLWRYVVWLVLVGACVLFYTWSQVDAQESALALTELHDRYEVLRVDHERLELELAVQRNVATLNERARALQLVESPVVEVK
jgi:hypothetical protein